MAALPDSTSDLLAFARRQRAVADRAEADILATAVAWADAHPALVVADAAMEFEHALTVAGDGAPLVAEFCIAELAAALGLTTDAGRRLVGDALDLAHRLPRTYARTQEGTLQAWRARRIAQCTRHLSWAAADFVDQQVAAFAHKIGLPTLDRLVTEAMERFDPAQAEAAAKSEHRKVDVHTRGIAPDGLVDITACVDLDDAHDVEQAIARRAEFLREQGSDDSLDARRAAALGEMARADLALDLITGERTPDGTPAGPTRELRLHVDANDLEAALHGEPVDGTALARVEKTRSFIDLDALRAWLSRPGTRIAVRAVVDTAATVRVDRWEIPARLRRHIEERDGACRFPHCTRPAHASDIDHIDPFDPHGPPGQTSSDNLAALCRTHHRHKTHTSWRYRMLDPGHYLWTSPHGHRYLVTPSGTETL